MYSVIIGHRNRKSACVHFILLQFYLLPDVAQFGRALALGARCRRFESCHPDQKFEIHFCGFRTFLFCGRIRTHLNATVRWTVAATSSQTGGYLDFCLWQKCKSNPVIRTMRVVITDFVMATPFYFNYAKPLKLHCNFRGF